MINFSVLNWLVLCLLFGTATASALTAVTWRQMRQPFYALNARSAESRLQTQIIITLALILLTIVALGARRWQASGANSAEIASTQLPPTQAVRSLAELVTITPTFEPTATRSPTATPEPTPKPIGLESRAPALQLPDVYSSVPLRVPTGRQSSLSNIVFASRLFPNRRPADPAPFFTTDIDTLYATFEYRNMNDDMAWSWVWRKGGKVIDGGNMYWDFGKGGPAFVYLEPPEGFEAGIYSAELWLNNELFQRAEVELFDDLEAIEVDEPVLVVTTPEVFKPPFNLIKDLPPVYNQVEPKLEMTDLTALEIVSFNLEMTTLRVDEEETETGIRPIALAATFQHNAMEPGMSWSWVWRLNDELIGGGNELWSYNGNEPRGVIHLLPETVGAGEYILELWVNGEKMSSAVLNVTGG